MEETAVEVHRLRAAIGGGAGLGLIAGGLETFSLPFRLATPMEGGETLVAGAAAVGAMGIIGIGLGLLLGPPILWLFRRSAAPTAVAAAVTASGGLLAGFYVWQASYLLLGEGRPLPAAIIALLPIGVAGIIWYNASYWVQRLEVGRPVGLGWGAVSAGLAGALVVFAAIGFAVRPTVGSKRSGKSLVLITVDGLRRDAVGVLGGDPTPAIDEMGREGMVFTDAVTPDPASGPANAAALSGLHPLRNRRIADSDPLIRAVKTLPEVLVEQGYTTGAFVSRGTVAAETGQAQGFQTYDDRFVSPWVRIRLFSTLADPLSYRAARGTVRAFTEWLDTLEGRPAFAWVHLADPALAVEGGADYREAVLQVDASVRQIREALDHADRKDAPIIIAGTYGEMAGEHGIRGAAGLFDPVVRVPLVVQTPRLRPLVGRPAAQVRLMDIPATILDLLALEPSLESEGVSLTGYGTGLRKAAMSCALLARAPDGAWQIGIRNNGVKYIESDTAQLYDLSQDPGEMNDIAALQPGIVAQAQSMISGEKAALTELNRR